jgi:glycosyltransferase involved in cell wall biosynthesis
MKVLYAIGSGRGWAGARTTSMDLLEGSIAAGHSIHVLSWMQEDVLEYARKAGLETSISSAVVRRSYALEAPLALARIIRRTRTDVVYTMFQFPARAHLRIAGALSHVPVVTGIWSELHWNPQHTISRLQMALDRVSARGPGAIVVPSRALYAQVLDIGIPRRKVRLIPHGVRPDLIASTSAPCPDEVGAFISRFRHCVAYVGRLDSNKNQIGAVSVFAKANVPDACLVLIGAEDEPAYTSKIEACARSLGIADRVYLAGGLARDSAWAVLRRTSVFLQTSRHEGFGQAPLEAQALGIPVVGYAAGGLADVVSDALTGFQVPVGNEELAASRLRALVADDGLRASFGAAAVKWVRARFDLRKNLPVLFALFEEMASSRTASKMQRPAES